MSVVRRAPKTAAELAFAEQFAAAPRSPAARRAFQTFEKSGVPGRRTESWHYTDLRSTLTSVAPSAPAPNAARIAEARALLAAEPRLAAARLVVLDGRFVAELSDGSHGGATLAEGTPNPVVDPADDSMLALGGALATGGFALEVEAGADLGKVEIVHISRPGFSSAAHLSFVFGADSRGFLIERLIGASAGSQRHRLTRLEIAAGASVDHVVALGDAPDLDLESQVVSLGERAEFRSFALVTGGKLTRRQVFAKLTGHRAKISFAGLSLLDGTRKADTTLEVTHMATHGESREFFRHVIAGEAAGVFQGKVIVEPKAQKTDGGMKSQAILLSPTASMSNKPELEIFADDVVCGHGATVGALDPEQLFYLQARGLAKAEAESMLLEAFGAEAVERIGDEEVSQAILELASAWFRGQGRRPMSHPAPAYDLAAVRAEFPILAERPYGKPLVYLDNAASAQKPQVVLDRLNHFYSHEYANVHRGLHYLANAATDAYEAARESVRRFLNAGSVEEIVFARSATEAINLVASSFGLEHIGAGDEIVLSVMEHHANIVPWHFHRERKGAVLKWVDVADDGSLSLEAFEAALSPRTKIVAISQMSNVLGTAAPIADIVRIAHARGIPVLVDGSQGAVHGKVDVRALDVDFYVMTGHKLYGPTGIGVLYGKAARLEALPPFNGGGEMIGEVTRDIVTYNQPPHRFEAGTPPIAQAVGLGAALDYMEGVGREAIAAHEAALSAYAHERLSRINSLRMIGTAPGKGPILSFTMEGAHAHDVATVIDRSGVAVRAGTHCAMPLLQRYGVTSTCRASFALYNTFEEVDVLAEALIRAQKLFA